jgi:branched-chain amino acid transport system substrate-binding protein
VKPSMRRTGMIALAVSMSLAVAACGSDGDSDADTDGDGTTATVETTSDTGSDTGGETTDAPTGTTDTTGTDGSEPAADADGLAAHAVAIPDETGPADESLDPVVIGVINMDEGTPSYPDVSTGIDAAAALVNAELGGIQGRPVEIRHCNVGVDQATNQQCAQEFANDDEVGLVIQGYAFGSGFTLQILEAAGLPTLLQTPLTPPDFNATLGWGYVGGNAGGTAGTAAYAAKYLDAQNIVIIGSDNDALRAAVSTIEALPAVEGRTVDVTYVSETAADITADIQASGALEADAVLPLINAPQCLQVAQALVDVGVTAPKISTTTCATPTTLDTNAEIFDGWTVVGSGLPPLLPDGESPELDWFMEKFPEYGDEAKARSFLTLGGFGSLLAAQRIGNELPETLSREDWVAGLSGFTGPYFSGPIELSCPGPHFPAVCNNEVRAWQLDDQGQLTLVEDYFDGLS